jgi:hypothetical protein
MVLEKAVVERVGAWRITYTVDLELRDGRTVKADVYAVIVGLGGRSAATLVACFEGARNFIGVRTLEDLGLKVDPVSGKIEASRPKNVVYFYGGGPEALVEARKALEPAGRGSRRSRVYVDERRNPCAVAPEAHAEVSFR